MAFYLSAANLASSMSAQILENEATAANSFIIFHALHPKRMSANRFQITIPKARGKSLENWGAELDAFNDPTGTQGIAENPLTTDALVAGFYAFVNDFEETFASSWDSQQFYGKQDPIVGFKNTKRTMSLSWKIPSASLEYAKNAYYNLNKLTQMLYPVYLTPSDATGRDFPQFQRTGGVNHGGYYPHSLPLSKPPLISVGWSNLIKNRDTVFTENGPTTVTRTAGGSIRQSLVCHVENLSLSPGVEAGYYIENSKMYPKLWNCGIALTIVHTHELGRQEELW